MTARRRLFGRTADDRDVRGEHAYPDEGPPNERSAAQAPETGLRREAGQYVAGADGTQAITTPRPKHE